LRDDEDGAAIPAINEDAGQWRKQKRRDLAGKAHSAEENGGFGEVVNEPCCGYAGHPGADERDGLAGEKEAEVAMAQGAPGVGKAWGGGLGHFFMMREWGNGCFGSRLRLATVLGCDAI